MYTPILIGAQKRYRIELPIESAPVAYKTFTSPMRYWDGQLIKSQQGHAEAFVRHNGILMTVEGKLVGQVLSGNPCFVMEHLTIDGKMELIIGDKNILNGNQNFANFGIPNGKHIRIDIYTGESKVIE